MSVAPGRPKPLSAPSGGQRAKATRAIGAKSVEPCTPQAAQRASGYFVGGTSPFELKREMPVWVEESVLALERIVINGGARGFLVGIAPRVLTEVLGAKPVRCAL